ncbi:MAG: hypothetical protein JOZ41_12540 [Chloroflexi bacterium]|nr:hypothetical protein [Chloroflexota bacterium]
MTVNRTETTADRLNDLARESTRTLSESISLGQKQSAQFLQAWLDVADANQRVSREITTQLIRQTQSAGATWLQLVQGFMRPGFLGLPGVQLPQIDRAVEDVRAAQERVIEQAGRAEDAARRAQETLDKLDKLVKQVESRADRAETAAKRAEKATDNLEAVREEITAEAKRVDSAAKRAKSAARDAKTTSDAVAQATENPPAETPANPPAETPARS